MVQPSPFFIFITPMNYHPSILDSFPADLADSLLEMALERTGIKRNELAHLSDDDKKRLDEVTWRLVTAADVSDSPCAD